MERQIEMKDKREDSLEYIYAFVTSEQIRFIHKT